MRASGRRWRRASMEELLVRPGVAQRAVRRHIRSVSATTALVLLLAACTSGGGGGGGGGGGNTDYVLSVLLVNRHTETHTLSYSGGAPLANSPDDEEVESCSAAIVYYTVEVPFELLVDGVPVIISDELAQGVPEDGATDLIATIDVLEDGTAVPVIGDTAGGSAVAAGRGISKPAQTGICL